MVKWVADIEVSDKESSNFYHHHDNRALPSEVDEQRAEAEGAMPPKLCCIGATKP